MKKLISLILTVLLLLSLLSCGGKKPSEDPSTPAADPAVLAVNSVPYESTYFLAYTTQHDVNVTVFRSVEELAPYVQKVDSEFSSMADWLRNHATEPQFKNSMRAMSFFYGIFDALEKYNSESFFRDNVLLLIDYRGGDVENIVTTDVLLTQSNGKKQLPIDHLFISQTGAFGEGESFHSVLMALPADIGVDFENDVVLNKNSVKGSLYDPEGSILYPYTTNHWGWKWE